jgi:hypothetical protein
MEFPADGIQAISLNFSIAFAAWWRQELLETVLAIQIAFLLNESNVHKFTSAVGIHAQEVGWAPCFSECGNEWSSDWIST